MVLDTDKQLAMEANIKSIPDTYTIKAERQENGLYGTSFLLKEYYPLFTDDYHLQVKHSALIMAIAEVYKRPFRVSMTDKDGFLAQIIGGNTFYVNHNDYNFALGELMLAKQPDAV